MDLNQLQYFVTVAKTENITKAAQELYITQPALSRAVARLEAELGVRLFDRKTNALILNENGQIFLDYVVGGLESINTGVGIIREKNSNRKLTISNYAFLDDFSSFCDRCLAMFPNMNLETFDATRSVSDFPTETAPDIVLIPEKEYRGYTVVRTYTEKWCIMYHKNYNFRSDCDGEDITFEQLAQESIIFDSSPYDKSILTQLFHDLPANLKFATRSDESRISINRCQAIGIVPVAAFRSLKARVHDIPIEVMLVLGGPVTRTLYLAHRPGFLPDSDNQTILDLLDQHIAKELADTDEFMSAYFAEKHATS